MMRKLVFALSIAAGAGVAAGCKDDRPTPMKFDPAAGGYTGQGPGQGYKGAPTGGTQTTTTTGQ